MAEKYTRWSDKSTGINPFISDLIRYPNNITEQIILYGKYIFIGIPRIILAFILLFFSYFLSTILLELICFLLTLFHFYKNYQNNLQIIPSIILVFITFISLLPLPIPLPISIIKKSFKKLMVTIALYLVGVEYSISYANTSRVVGIRSDANSNKPFSNILPGDIILSNLTNALELFIYEYICSPLFVFPIYDENNPESSLCIGLSLSSAIYYTLQLGNNTNIQKSYQSQPLISFIQKAKKSNRPIVLFIEGTKTNATGVLEYSTKIFSSLSSFPTIHLSGITSTVSSNSRSNVISSTCPIDSHFNRLLYLASTTFTSQSYQITFLSSKYIPKSDKNDNSSSSGPSNQLNIQAIEKWIDEIRNIFSKLVNKKTLKLNLSDYYSYANYYNALKSGNNDLAKSLADKRGK